ncbi:MAG: thiol peroxidase [Candidatus Erginobacter occultus]|nr:thiol peroxidase [Candidatus Erginobacter occultus]
MNEKTVTVTMKGEPLNLTGDYVPAGSRAPTCRLTDGELKELVFDPQGQGNILLITVPSLDTSVCSKEAQRLSREIEKLGDEISAVLISMDLPFAQKRWSEAAGIDNIRLLSDHRLADFGRSYGILIEDLRLLARSLWVIDGVGTIRYKQLVGEVTDEPDYDQALAAIEEVLRE